MVKIFFGNRSGVLLLLPIMIAAYVVVNWYTGYHTPELNTVGFLGIQLDSTLWWSMILAPCLILINAIVVNNIFNRNGFMERNIYLPGLFYVVFKSFFYSFYYVSGLGVAELLLILALMQLYKLDQNTDGRRAVFNAAFFLGVGSTVYPLMMISILFFFWMIWVLRPFQVRESALALVGFVLPLTYTGIYGTFFGIELTGDFLSSSSSEWLVPDIYVAGGGVFLLALTAVGPVFKKLSVSSIRLKKVFRVNVLVSMFVLSLALIEYLVYGKIESSSMITGILVLFIPYAYGDRNPRPAPTILFYMIFFFSVSKFFISYEI